jgi:sugar O-acyltransferase (sialic acid O-acetyltransferase NeuD family)
MENPVMILGASSIGAMALDIFKKNEVVVFGMLDDNPALHNTEIDDIAILGATDDEGYTKLIGKKCEAFVATDDSKLKKHLVAMLTDRRHTMPVNAIHPSAQIGTAASMGHGNLVAANTHIGPQVQLGSHCNILPGAVIDVGATLADYVQIGINASIGAGVQVAEGAFVGQGACVVPGIQIGKNARVGAGSVVVENVAANSTVFGNPAKKIS